MTDDVPDPTPVFRITHIDNLDMLLTRSALHAPNHGPNDGLRYKTIHDVSVQESRVAKNVPCGPRGTIHDYVPFYIGPRSPMLYNLANGYVDGYTDGQESLIYLVTTAQAVSEAELGFAFSDGHGLATFTSWFDDLDQLGEICWDIVYSKYWFDTVEEPDRKRRKQAEFLIHESCPWELIEGIAVYNQATKQRVEAILSKYPAQYAPPVEVVRKWYY